MLKITKPTLPLFRSPNTKETWISEGLYVRELVNHPDHPVFSLARCRLPAGQTTQLHRLDVDETYVIEKGTGIMRVDEETFPVTAGDTIPVPKGTPQNITNNGQDDLIFLVVCIPRFTMVGYKAV